MKIRKIIDVQYTDHFGQKRYSKIQLITVNDFKSLAGFIDQYISDIVFGEINHHDIGQVKKEIVNLIRSKTSFQRVGLMGEFFTHVILRSLGFIQESTFKNLEERSPKKGFDGLYSKEDTIWIAESKSTNTQNIIHKEKIREALLDLKTKLEGKTKNNPFENATYHMIAAKKERKDNLFDYIKQLSDSFSNEKYPRLDEYNVIPVSTLFFQHAQSDDEIINEISNVVMKKEFRSIIAICVDNSLYYDFLNYLVRR